MVPQTMYDAVAAIEETSSRSRPRVTAPPGLADAAVAQAARDVLVTLPGQTAAVQAALYDAFMAAIPAGPAKDGGKLVGVAAADWDACDAGGDHFDDVVPYVQKPPGPGVFEPIAPTPPVTPGLALVRLFTTSRPRITGRGRRSR